MAWPAGPSATISQPGELAHRAAYLDQMAEGRYQLGFGSLSALPTDEQLFGLTLAAVATVG